MFAKCAARLLWRRREQKIANTPKNLSATVRRGLLGFIEIYFEKKFGLTSFIKEEENINTHEYHAWVFLP